MNIYNMNYYLLLNIKINKTIYKMYLMYCEDSFAYFTKICNVKKEKYQKP